MIKPLKKRSSFLSWVLFCISVLLVILPSVCAHEQQTPGSKSGLEERSQDNKETTLYQAISSWIRSIFENGWVSGDQFMNKKNSLISSLLNENNDQEKLQKIIEYEEFLQKHEQGGLSMPFLDQNRDLIQFLNRVYDDKDPQSYRIKSIIEKEMHLIAHKKSLDELVQISMHCDGLSRELVYLCYRPILQEIATKDKDSVQKMILILKDRWLEKNADQCHFLHHELGYALYDLYGLKGVDSCLDTYDECSYGCYHGIAEEFTLLTYTGNISSILASRVYQNMLHSELSFETWNLHHGMGHAFYEIHDDLRRAFVDCEASVSMSSPRTQACYYGAAHEFSIFMFHQNKSLADASKYCPSEFSKRRPCLYMLGQTYTLKQGMAKTVRECEIVNDSACFVGMAAIIAVGRNSLSKAETICQGLFPEEMKPRCYEGFAISYIFYDNDLNGAFEACTLGNQSHCYAYLKRAYENDLWFQGELCDHVQASKREECISAFEGII